MTPVSDDIRRARFSWCLYDWANSAFATVIIAAVFPVYFASLIPPGGLEIPGFDPLPATAAWGYAISLSLALIAVVAPYLGARGDRLGKQRHYLTGFTLAGASATAALALTGAGDVYLAAGLFMAANFAFAASNIFYNGFLPQLADHDEIDRLSARGYAYGYIGGGLAMLMVFLLIHFHRSFGFSDAAAASRAGFLLTGLWWGLFAIPLVVQIRPLSGRTAELALPRGFGSYLRTFTDLRRYRDLLIFLFAFLLYNDGVQTIISVSAIFAREELGLGHTAILGCFLMIQFLAMPGALGCAWLADRIGTRKVIQGALCLFILVTVAAYFMQTAWQFWVLGAVVALIFGGTQSLSRSLYGSLIPAGRNSEYFGFFAISNKFASIAGPLLFALISHLTGSARLAILALTGLFLAGMTLLALVDVDRGRALVRKDTP